MRHQLYRILFFLFLTCTSVGMQAQKNARYHTVQEGQTLYSIARLYNIPPTELIKLNPGAGDLIRPGDKLRIPADATAQPVATGPGAQFVGSSAAQPSQNPCKEMYQIKKKDNLYRIALEHNISIDELLAVNPGISESSKLKKGEWLCIPYTKAEKQAEADRRAAELKATANTKQSKKSHLNMAVVLPLKENTERGGKMIEFYQGLLMAVDSVRKQGVSVDVFAYHSGNSVAELNAILDKEEMKQMDVIFGPLDGVQANILSSFCKKNKTRLVMPFATTNTYGTDNPYVYIASARNEAANQNFAAFATKQFATYNCVELNCGQPDNRGTAFLASFSQQLSAKGMSIKQLAIDGDDLNYATALNQFRNNLVILNTSSTTALRTATKKLKAFMSQHPEYTITLLGYPEWSTLQGTILTDLHALDTYLMVNYYRNPTDTRVQAFEERFTSNFHYEATKTARYYGIEGLDLGYYFLNGLAKLGDNFDARQQSLGYQPLQNPYLFKQEGEGKAFVNNSTMLVHYTPSGSIKTIK